VGVAQRKHYDATVPPGLAAIRPGLARLQEPHPGGRLVLEGRKPVEVNLQHATSPICAWPRSWGPVPAGGRHRRVGVFCPIYRHLALLRPVSGLVSAAS